MAARALAVVLVGVALAPGRADADAQASVYSLDGVDTDALLDRMTVEEKVGQLLLVGFGGTTMDATIARFLDETKPGGIALFSRNIESTQQTVRLIRAIRAHDPLRGDPRGPPNGIPPFIGVDQEGGNVVRLKRATVLPSAMALGAAHDDALAHRVGAALGRDLRTLGFNMNLAPVLDVNSNPQNPVIGTRSFGADPAEVAQTGIAYLQGLQSAGVLAVAKHFPGHGDTDTDSHFHLPVVAHDRARLDAVELLPFARAFASGLKAIMTAHIVVPAFDVDANGAPDPTTVDGQGLPATLNPHVLTTVLREQLGYDGLVITDGLEMQGVVERFGSGEAAVRAVVAGADMVMVLWSVDKKREVREALLAAAKSGRIPAARLDQAVRRVLRTKAEQGLFSATLMDERTALHDLSTHRSTALMDEVARRAMTLVENDGHVVPLRAGKKIAVASTEGTFLDVLKRKRDATTFRLTQAPTRARVEADIARFIEMSADADVIVVGIQTGEYAPLVSRLAQRRPGVPIVVVSFGSPYLRRALPHVAGYLCAFGFREDSERAAARVLIGEVAARGRLPVPLFAARTADARQTADGAP